MGRRKLEFKQQLTGKYPNLISAYEEDFKKKTVEFEMDDVTLGQILDIAHILGTFDVKVEGWGYDDCWDGGRETGVTVRASGVVFKEE